MAMPLRPALSPVTFARMRPKPSTPAGRLMAVQRHLSVSAKATNGGGAAAAKAGGSAQTTDIGTVSYTTSGTTRVFKLERPKQLNALDEPMMASMTEAAKSWRNDPDVQLIVGTGDDRAFCAGGDVKTLVWSRKSHGPYYALEFFRKEFETDWVVGRTGKTFVAMVDGVWMGGGAGISMSAQIRVATPRTIFAMPEVKIGYAADVASSYYLSQLDGYIGEWLAVTGQELWGRATYDLGVATHYIDHKSIPTLMDELKALKNPTAESVADLVSSYQLPPGDPSAAPSSKESRDGRTPITGEIRTFLDATFSLPSIGEVYAALQAAESSSSLSPEVKTWAATQCTMMDDRSPSGMAVALEKYKRARATRRLDAALTDDMLVATGFCGTNRPTEDFTTGVTHLLLEKKKGRAPWSPNLVTDAALSPEKITKAFLDPTSEHLKESPPMRFIPKPTTPAGSPDSTWGKFRKFGLPSEAAVLAVLNRGDGPGSGKGEVRFRLSEGLLIAHVVDATAASKSRRDQVEEAVRKIIKQRCEVDPEGKVTWKK